MTRARKEQVCIEATPYYHCVSRCVRRAFLCGRQYEHRRKWVEDKLLELAQIFCIDIAAYAIMSNHYHVVLFIDKYTALKISNEEVIDRWHKIYRGTVLSQRYISGEELTSVELKQLQKTIIKWRARLMDISWFMRNMNETIARQANSEDNCTGRFWEGRFKSQALLDEKALIACMAYVDLNPVRAKVAQTPEKSAYTSVKRRCDKAKQAKSPNHKHQQVKSLLPFLGNSRQDFSKGIAFNLKDYLELIDWSSRVIRSKKTGSVATNTPPILIRLGITERNWNTLIMHFEVSCKSYVGGTGVLERTAQLLGLKNIPQYKQMKVIFA